MFIIVSSRTTKIRSNPPPPPHPTPPHPTPPHKKKTPKNQKKKHTRKNKTKKTTQRKQTFEWHNIITNIRRWKTTDTFSDENNVTVSELSIYHLHISCSGILYILFYLSWALLEYHGSSEHWGCTLLIRRRDSRSPGGGAGALRHVNSLWPNDAIMAT